MPRLPHTIEFNDLDFPELSDIFRSIDAGIAAIVASDPTLRPRPAQKRRQRKAAPAGTVPGRSRAHRKAA